MKTSKIFKGFLEKKLILFFFSFLEFFDFLKINSLA